MGGRTNTARALRSLRTEGFLSIKGARLGFNNVAILFTESQSSNFHATIEEARMARLSGITILVVVLSSWFNAQEVAEIASDPDDMSVFYLSDIRDITGIKRQLQDILCRSKFDL